MKQLKTLKIHEILFYCFLFLVPIQTRILYKPDQAYIGWYFNYHLAFFVYLSDIILIACFIAWGIFDRPQIKLNRFFELILAFFAVILISLFHVKQLGLGLYQSLKWLELLGLLVYIYLTFKQRYQFEIIAWIVLISGIIQSLVALAQFHVQHGLGLGLLGEYIAPLGTSGLATIDTAVGKVIRAYGTMPHPNILGAFLVFSLICGLYLASHETITKTHPRESGDPLQLLTPIGFDSGSRSRIKSGMVKIPIVLCLILILLGIFTTFSRLAWLGTALSFFAFLVYYSMKRAWPAIKVIVIVSLVSCATIFGFYHNDLKARVTNSDPVSISDRGYFDSLGLKLIKQQPLLGVGVGNYVPALEKSFQLQSWQYQPAHNIFIFLAAEIGLVGLILFLWIVREIFFRASAYLREPFGFAILTVGFIFLFLSLFDHYFLTIQQGRLMFFLVLGLIAAFPNLYAQKSD